jgi:hypothetical protein
MFTLEADRLNAIRFYLQPSQDLSPIYEEIHGGSRSSISGTSVSSGGSRSVISTGSSATGNDAGPAVSVTGIERGKFYYALYEFAAAEASMMPLFRGQVKSPVMKWIFF